MSSPGAPERPCCLVGARPDIATVNAALRLVGQPGGESLSAVALRFGIAKSSLHKHRAHAESSVHEDAERQAERPGTTFTAGTVDPTLYERKVAEAKPILARSEKLERRAWRLLRQVESGAVDVDTVKAAASLLGKIKDALQLQAQIAGEIKAASTTVNVYNSPDWHRLRDLLVEALAPHPDALGAVIAVLESEQRGDTRTLN